MSQDTTKQNDENNPKMFLIPIVLRKFRNDALPPALGQYLNSLLKLENNQ